MALTLEPRSQRNGKLPPTYGYTASRGGASGGACGALGGASGVALGVALGGASGGALGGASGVACEAPLGAAVPATAGGSVTKWKCLGGGMCPYFESYLESDLHGWNAQMCMYSNLSFM